MIPKECKRLAEVDFPIAVVSKHAAREKSIRHGHPSTLHLWWARRPLASCRAVLLALLLPDPCDPLCPSEFNEKAAKALLTVPGWNTPKRREQVKSNAGLHKALLDFIADVANWDVANNPDWIAVARHLVKAAHPDEPPLVVDPFAGGGSIPLEALRLGCEAFASDLNPVACLILKVMLEDIPRHGPELAVELRRVGAEIKQQAEKELADLYPKDPDGATPIAYLWARTVRCESPNCGAEIPLVRSFWLCKKANRRRALRPVVSERSVEFEIFEPKSDKEVPEGTVSRARARCLVCGAVLPPERVRAQLAAQRGGADVVFDAKGKRTGGARLLAVVTLKPGGTGRHYRLPNERDYEAVHRAQKRLAGLLEEWDLPAASRSAAAQAGRGGKKGLCPVPDEPLPPIGTLGFRVQRYSMLQWGDLFTARQKVALVTLSRLVRQLTTDLPACLAGRQPASRNAAQAGLPAASRGSAAQAGAQRTQREDKITEAVREGMALQLAKGADGNSSGARWMPGYENPANTFGRQALPIVWDFCESTPYADARGVFLSALDSVAEVIHALPKSNTGHVQPADATEHPLPDAAATVWFTDPPYYDAVPYADLSDFFFVWLKRALPGHSLLRDPFDPANPLTPKSREAVQNERSETEDGRPKDKAFYEEAMAKAFAEGRRVLREDGVGAVVFAHKTTEGWEALLSGMIRGGWTITGSWPIATEMASRLRARDSAALATSVHLICRPRPEDAPVGDWADVLRELPRRIAGDLPAPRSHATRQAGLPAPRRDKYYIYVLKCADESFYIGQTDDVRRRFGEHQAGKVSWTKARQPLEIIHWEEFDTREQAVEREKHLKTGFGRQWLKREYEKGKLAARQAGWMERLQGEGVRGADLVFACIGPALEIFSRYSRVETADGREVKLAEYLEKVWEVVGRAALEQVLGTAEARARNGAAGAVEEDARLTALFLWTLQTTNGQSEAETEEPAEVGQPEEEGESSAKNKKGYTLVFDVVRRFAQPLGIELPKWEGRIIQTEKGIVRLLSVTERAEQLFGEDGADAVAHQLERDPMQDLQQVLFPELQSERAPKIRGRRQGRIAPGGTSTDPELKKDREATTLDRVHAAMLLQAGGQTNGLRALIKAEMERGPDFLRLANALSALYPKASEEKRLLDAMLLAIPR